MVAKPAGGTARRIFSPSPTQMDEASVCESVLTIIIRPARGGAGPPAAPSAHPLRRAPAPLPTVIKPVCLRVKPCVCAKTAGGNRGSARRRFLWACDATESAAIYSVNTFITHRGDRPPQVPVGLRRDRDARRLPRPPRRGPGRRRRRGAREREGEREGRREGEREGERERERAPAWPPPSTR